MTVWQVSTASIVTIANANDINMVASFGSKGRGLTGQRGRESRSAARDRPLYALQNQAEAAASADRLDSLQVERARLPVIACTDVIAETLAGGGRIIVAPGNSGLVEAQVVAAGFRLDLAVTQSVVERFDGSKIFHGRIPLLAQAWMAGAG
jgi:hypothetical protein